MNSHKYPGQELTLFAGASHWKDYWVSQVQSVVRGKVLEVGAGMGSNSPFLLKHCQQLQSLTLLEPDAALVKQIPPQPTSDAKPVKVIHGSIHDLEPSARFDTILYIDVLEHLQEDRQEISKVQSHLNPSGHLIILVPAHQFLYSAFDGQAGHYRRYNKALMHRIISSDLKEVTLKYLDSLGCVASAYNRIRQQPLPTGRQIRFWDGVLVPLSRWLDLILFYQVGKSLLGVWQKKVCVSAVVPFRSHVLSHRLPRASRRNKNEEGR